MNKITRIYFDSDQLDDVRFMLDVIIPNDLKVFVKNYEIDTRSGVYNNVKLELESQRDWDYIKRVYFPDYMKPALPNCITLKKRA